MSRSYTSSPTCASIGVLWDGFAFMFLEVLRKTRLTLEYAAEAFGIMIMRMMKTMIMTKLNFRIEDRRRKPFLSGVLLGTCNQNTGLPPCSRDYIRLGLLRSGSGVHPLNISQPLP
jgi:hypothetical protein